MCMCAYLSKIKYMPVLIGYIYFEEVCEHMLCIRLKIITV